MTDEDKPRFTAALRAMARTYRAEVDADWFAGYWLALRGLTVEVLEAAIGDCMGSEARLPVPAMILARTRTPEPDEATRAWADVRRQISAVGWAGRPKLTPAQAAAVVAVGDWQRLCDASSKDLDFIGRDFTAVYGAAQRETARKALNERSAPPRHELPAARADYQEGRKDAATAQPESLAAIWGRMEGAHGHDRG